MFLVNKMTGETQEVKAEKRGLLYVLFRGKLFLKDTKQEAFTETRIEANSVLRKLGFGTKKDTQKQ